MRKIIGFDSWTQGGHFFERLVPALKAQGFELVLIHLGSWGHDQGRPQEERFGEMVVRDISYYGGIGFLDILRQERPDAVLFFSMTSLAHRCFNRYCKHLGIPTAHLYHGLVTVQATHGKRINPINQKRQAWLILNRAGKNLTRILPNYAYGLLQTRASVGDWLWLARDVIRKIQGRSYTGIAAPDSSTTRCCVYVKADIEHAVSRYRMPREWVLAVGNPDIGVFGLEEGDLGCCLRRQGERREIIYIDTALIECGSVFEGADDFIGHLESTSEMVKSQGYLFAVKLHPAMERNRVGARLRALGISIVARENFVSRLRDSVACLVEPSSAAIVPALLGIPVLLVKYGKMSEQEYGDVLTAYPLGAPLTNLGELPRLIQVIEARDVRAQAMQWIDENVGPMPASDQPARVAAMFEDMVVNCSRL